MSKTRIHDSTRVLASYKETSMSETIEPTTKPVPPAPLSQNEWDRLLKEAGWRDATLDGPIAFELPAPPSRSCEEWIRQLKELGWKDGTLLPGHPTAFELPAPPRRQTQDDK